MARLEISQKKPNPDDLIFNTFSVESKPETLYVKLASEFTKVPKGCWFRRQERRNETKEDHTSFVTTLCQNGDL